MNSQIAITLLKDLEQSLDDYCELNDEGKTVFSMAIEALEKQIPKKFKVVNNTIPICPVCGEEVWDMDWCNYCGQRIDDEAED